VPKALKALEEAGAIMPLDDAWRLQTKEAAEWDAAYRAELRALRADPTPLSVRRRGELDTALSEALKGLPGIAHGRSSVTRKLVRLRPTDKPPTDGLAVRVYNGWDDTLKQVNAEITALPATDATIHLLIERDAADAERLEEALRQRMAAQAVLDQRGAPSTTEGEQAQKSFVARVSAADRTVKEIAEATVRKAQVILAGGSEQFGTHLKDRLQAGADGALVRLFPRFDIGDDPGWERVVTAARAGQADALKNVGHSGPPEMHPVCQAILTRLGAGRTGKELREEFERPLYGWPQDAVDGALLVLDHADLVRTVGEDGKEVALRSLPRQKIGVCRFHPETDTVTLAHRRAIRELGQSVGVHVSPDNEGEALTEILRRMREAARAAGGEAPAPEAPMTADLDAVEAEHGNRRLIEAATRKQMLADTHKAWSSAREHIDARLPAWRTTERLVALGAHGQQAAVEDIRARRRLLEEPDPVPPLRQDAAAELRARLNAALDEYEAALSKAETELKADANWSSPKINPDERHAIRQRNGLLPIPRPPVARPEDIVAALTSRSLSGWADLTRGIPAGVLEALDEAAIMVMPKVQAVNLPTAGTINDEAVLDAWLAKVRETIAAKLPDGPVRPRF
jgi:hypothetical protein